MSDEQDTYEETFDWHNESAVCVFVNANGKEIINLNDAPMRDLSLDDVALHQWDKIFDGETVRNVQVQVYPDVRILRAINGTATRCYDKNEQLMRYVAFLHGHEINGISQEMDEMIKIYNSLESGENEDLADMSDERHPIKQRYAVPKNGRKQNVSFIEEYEIRKRAKVLGITISAYVVHCYWLSVRTSPGLPKYLRSYGEFMVKQYENHFEYRLQFLRRLTNSTS